MQLVNFYQKLLIINSRGTKYTIVSKTKAPNDLTVEHTQTLTSKGVPGQTEISVYNIDKSHAAFFKKGNYVEFYAGWYNGDNTERQIGSVVYGKISRVTPITLNEADSVVNFTITDGQKYDNIKSIKVKKSKRVRVVASQKTLSENTRKISKQVDVEKANWINSHPKASIKQIRAKSKYFTEKKKKMQTASRVSFNKRKKELNNKKQYQIKKSYGYLSFKKGTKASTIIRSIAKRAGIKISKIKLNYDRKYIKGYTAKNKPIKCIEQIASDCKTGIIYKNDSIVISALGKNQKKNLYIDYDTGLLQEPEFQDDSDSSIDQWQITFMYRNLKVGDVFHLKSNGGINGWVIIMSGTNSFQNGSTPTTQVIVESYSAYKAKIKKQVKSKKKNDKKAKIKEDKKEQQALAKKREKRAEKRMTAEQQAKIAKARSVTERARIRAEQERKRKAARAKLEREKKEKEKSKK